jgi:lipopolysaccharide transport system ATP-binding protein
MSDTIITIRDAAVRFNLAMQRNMSLGEHVKRLLKKDLRFQEFFALRHINLDIVRGESWGFVGRNGSGKSTLLKLVTGILTPYEGTVAVSGTVAPLLELGAGFDIEMTGRENIMMNGLILGMTEQQVRDHFDDIVTFSELEKFLDVPVKNYSSGMRARLGFAVATSARADILIADEVLSTGDRKFQQKCENRMQDMLDSGTTLLFVSHSSDAVRKVCQKAMWLDHGECRMQGTVEEVLGAYEQV